MAGSEDKSEKPTGKRVTKARDEGQFISSRELIAAGQFLVFIWVLGIWFPSWFRGIKEMLTQALVQAFHADLDINTVPPMVWVLVQKAFVPLSVIAGLTGLTTISLQLALTKMGFSLKKFTPDLTRFNPAPKIKQIFQQGPIAFAQAASMLVLFGY